MPGVVGYGKSVTRIRRKRHLRLLRLASVRQHLVEDRADVRRGIIRRQIKLDGDPFPKTVGMLEDAVAGNVARQDGYRIHIYSSEVFSEAVFQPRRQPLDESRLQRPGTQHATSRIPDCAFFSR